MKKATVVVLIVAVLAGTAWWWFSWKSGGRSGEMLVANADDLKKTVVTAHLEAPITDGKNVLWCSTFQLAWNEACDLIGEDIHLQDEPPMVAILNKKSATKANIDEASYVAMAGWTKDGIEEKIRKAVRDKFGEDPRLRLIDEPGPMDASFVTYACLVKDLKFATPFEPIDDGRLKFRGTPVKAFGMTKSTGRAREIAKQVILFDEGEANNFEECLVELKTTSPDDRLILAMVKPAGTLDETVRSVSDRMAKATPQSVSSHEQVWIPRLGFDLLKEYSSLLGKNFKVADPELQRRFLVMALQTIRFQLNEYGAELVSEAKMMDSKSAMPMHAPPIFNKPFLIMLQRKDAKMPYFALWVDNVELLMPID